MLTGFVVFISLSSSVAQQTSMGKTSRWANENNPNYDNRKFSYGFLIGLHSSSYHIKHSNNFLTNDTLHSVTPTWKSGFSLGFIANYRIAEFFDIRLTPKVGFYENVVEYRYTANRPQEDKVIETAMVELPLSLKYKSDRRGNIRMYMIGGVNPSFEASGRKRLDAGEHTLEIKSTNLSLEAGFGFDLYYPLFKFSPELRFSRGIVDILENRTNPYGSPLRRVSTNTITLYLLFQ